MPTFSSQIVLSSGAQSAGVAGIDNQIVKGSLKSFESFTALQNEPVDRLATDQLAYVKDTSTWYVVTVTPPDYITSFEAVVEFTEFTGFASGTSGIFEQTGSYYSTTNDLQITGSLDLNLASDDTFSISVEGTEKLKMTGDGVLQLMAQEAPPTPVVGGIYFSSSGEFFFGS